MYVVLTKVCDPVQTRTRLTAAVLWLAGRQRSEALAVLGLAAGDVAAKKSIVSERDQRLAGSQLLYAARCYIFSLAHCFLP